MQRAQTQCTGVLTHSLSCTKNEHCSASYHSGFNNHIQTAIL